MLRLEPRINTLAIAGRNDTVNQPPLEEGTGVRTGWAFQSTYSAKCARRSFFKAGAAANDGLVCG